MGSSINTDPFNRLAGLILGHKKDIIAIYFYAILSGLLQLSVPIGIQAIIGFVLGASMVTSLYVLIFLVVLGVFLVGMMQINQMKIIEKIQQKIFTEYAFEFSEKIPRFDLLSSDNYYLPEKVNYFFDAINVQKGLSKLLLDVPVASIQILFGLLLLCLYHPIFIGFSVLLVSVLWLILKLSSRTGLSTSLEESNYKYSVVVWLEEMARVIKSFKFSQGTHLNLLKTDKSVTGYLRARTAHFQVLLLQYRTLVFFKVAITGIMLIVGTYLLLNQQLNIGEFIAAEIVILIVIAAVEKIIRSLNNVYDVVTGLEKLAVITDSPLEKECELNFDTNKDGGINIEMVDFSFGYIPNKPVLREVNLQIPARKTVCVFNNRGSGKSTFLKVLTGNYSDFRGSILLNKIPINNYVLSTLRSKIGIYLNQQDIFMGTVWENITMGREDLDANGMMDLAEKLGLSAFMNTLQEGFETQVHPAGKKLSSTTIKSILLLRAFAGQPDLLLLEEPWEGLGASVKDKMIGFILNGSAYSTFIIASDDQDFAKKCDCQIQLTNGFATMISNEKYGSIEI